MNRQNETESPVCKECGENISDTYFSSDYCDECLQRHEQEDNFTEDDE